MLNHVKDQAIAHHISEIVSMEAVETIGVLSIQIVLLGKDVLMANVVEGDVQDLNLFHLQDVKFLGQKLELDVYLVQDQQISQHILNVHFIHLQLMQILILNVKEYFVVVILELTVSRLNHHGLMGQWNVVLVLVF